MGNFFVRYVYGALNDYGIDTKDMEPYEAIEKYNELIDKGKLENKKQEENDSENIIYSYDDIVLNANNEHDLAKINKNIENLINDSTLNNTLASYSIEESSSILCGGVENAGKQDEITKRILKTKGYTKNPQVFSKKQFDDYIKTGSIEMFRGVGIDDWKDEFINGDMYVGVGAKGSGIYAVEVDEDRESAYAQAKMYSTRINKNFKSEHIARLSMTKETKIIDMSELKEIKFTLVNKVSDMIDQEQDSIKRKELAKVDYAFNNMGLLATLLGYDMVTDKKSGIKYNLILNRGKVIIEDE